MGMGLQAMEGRGCLVPAWGTCTAGTARAWGRCRAWWAAPHRTRGPGWDHAGACLQGGGAWGCGGSGL